MNEHEQRVKELLALVAGIEPEDAIKRLEMLREQHLIVAAECAAEIEKLEGGK
jgi:hypothetical protein